MITKYNKTRAFEYAATLIIVFSGFIIQKIPSITPLPFLPSLPTPTDGLWFGVNAYFYRLFPIPPIYLCLVLGCFCLMPFIRKIYLPFRICFPLLVFLYFLVSQYFISGSFSDYIVMSSETLFNFLFFYFSLFVLRYCSVKKILHISVLFIKVSISLLVVEAIWRYMNPVIIPGNDFFYAFKIASIMSVDSNLVAIFIVVLIFFQDYLAKEYHMKSKKRTLILCILLLLTLSRAAILAAFLYALISYGFRKFKALAIIFMPIVLIAILVFIYIKIDNDPSFLTKFEIFDNAVKYYYRDPSIVATMFGVGFYNSYLCLDGYAGHNYILVYLLESGLIGLTLIATMWLLILKTVHKSYVILIPFFLTAMSAFGHYYAYLMVIIAIMYELQMKKGKNPTEIVLDK